jgi:hypothetical protein
MKGYNNAMQTKTKFIIFIVLVVLIVGGIGAYFGFKPQAPGKLDEFAKALTDKGAKFYGAFWCTHCQAQKAEFGSSKQYLPYIECSTSDGQGQNQICKDNKVEGYPTWSFKDSIKIASNVDPTICPIVPEGDTPSSECIHSSSKYFKVWIFPGYKFVIRGSGEPIKNGDVWTFPAGSQTSGEVPLTFLAEQIQFTLPQ